METLEVVIQKNLDSLLRLPFISSAITLGIGFYAHKAAPELPSFMEDLFNHIIFQIFVGFMMLYMSTQNVMLSFVVSVLFVYGACLLAKVKENMFGGSKFSNFMKNEFEEILTKKLKQKGITSNADQLQIQQLIMSILQEHNYTPEDMGIFLYEDNGDIEKHINNAITKASL